MYGIDWSLTIYMYTDASSFTGGMVIVQKPENNLKELRLIIYDMMTFNTAERKYPTYKRELCVIVKSAVKYKYLFQNLVRPGVIHTDHKPLAHFLDSGLHDEVYAH